MQATRHLRAANTIHAISGLPAGDAGVSRTLDEMRSIVRTWKVHPLIRQQALRLIDHCGQKQWRCEIEALHNFVRDRIRYVNDVADVETLQTPELTLRTRRGDCDDKCILLASLLQAIGHPARFVAVAFARGAPFSHVFVETRLGGYWIPCETTEPWPVGQRPPGIKRHLFRNV